MPESLFLLYKMKMNLRQIKLFWTYILICVHLIAQWIHPILIIRHPETRMCTPKVPYVYTLILILTLLYINIEGCQHCEYGCTHMSIRVYTYEYLGVHIRYSGCTQKRVYLMNILVYRYFIFTFYNKRILSSISG